MKLAVVCANGKAGQKIVEEALGRGLDVTAVVRGENRSAATQVVQKDLFDLTPQDLAGYDVVVDAFGAWTEDTLPLHGTSLQHLCDCLSGTGHPPAGGGGRRQPVHQPGAHGGALGRPGASPAEFLPLAQAQGKALEALRTRNDVQWTFLSPAADFQPEGARTGKYILAGEEFTCNAKGESVISYADYAIALVDEAVSGAHPQARISVVGE